MKRIVILFLVVVPAALLLQHHVAEQRMSLEEEESEPFSPPRPHVLKTASLGYHTLVADFYWLAAIQYYAQCIEEGKFPKDLYSMADFITDLDPRYGVVYYFTGLNLMIEVAERRKVESILEKGARNRPDNWRIFFFLGFYQYFVLGKYYEAAQNLETVCKLRDHFRYCLLASRIRAEAGEPGLGIRFLREMYKQTENEYARGRLYSRIQELRTRQMEMELDSAAEKFRDREGRYPSALEELVEEGILKAVPEHPMQGHEFVLDSEEKTVRSEPRVKVDVSNFWRDGK